MKLLIPQTPAPKDEPRSRALVNVQAELFRLTVAVDEIKVNGTLEDLDATQKVLWGALLVVDGLLGRRR